MKLICPLYLYEGSLPYLQKSATCYYLSHACPHIFFQIYFNNNPSNFVSVFELTSFLLASLVTRAWRTNLGWRRRPSLIQFCIEYSEKKQWRTADRGWSPTLGVEREANKSLPENMTSGMLHIVSDLDRAFGTT